MNTKIKLYTTAEALSTLINLMLDTACDHDYMTDSVKSIAKLLSDVTDAGDVVELLENYGFKFALYHTTGVRYWFRLCELSDSIDEEVNCNA